jgi:predicted naringenin-chalcone synthase
MTLSGYVPDLIEEDFEPLVKRALTKAGISLAEISHWCVHPGGRKILEVIEKTLQLPSGKLDHSYQVLKEYGNMSSPTLLFVLKKIMQQMTGPQTTSKDSNVFAAAFGPGLTMETFVASY